MDRPSPAAEAVTERVRALCVALPDVEERTSHGEATWFVRGGRQFATMSDHHHDDRVSVVFAAAEGVQADLVSEDPERYFRPPYVGGRGWVGARLDGSGGSAPDWDVLGGLIAEAFELVAPARRRSSP